MATLTFKQWLIKLQKQKIVNSFVKYLTGFSWQLNKQDIFLKIVTVASPDIDIKN